MSEPSALERLLEALDELATEIPTVDKRERERPIARALEHSWHAWLDQEATPEEFARQLYWALHKLLIAEGMDPFKASRLAFRPAELALRLLAGSQQKEVADLLRVSERTAKTDARLIRRVIQDGRLHRVPGRSLPPVPKRIKPENPPARQRKAS